MTSSPYLTTGSAAFEIEADDEPTDQEMAVAEIHYGLTLIIQALVRLGPRERAYWLKQIVRTLTPLTTRVVELVASGRPN
jgi:hypothetical protein